MDRQHEQGAKYVATHPRLAVLLLMLATLLIVGCGSAATTTLPVPTSAPNATSPAATGAASSATGKAASASSGPPDFVLNETTQSGDKLKIEGRFGPLLPAGESDVDQSALGECPGVDGRELITRLDMTATIESGLSASVMLINFSPSPATRPVDFVIDSSEGATCSTGGNDALGEESEEEARSPDLGTLQPHKPHDLTVWVILTDAITPNDPHPTTATLAHQQWLIHPLEAKVDNSRAGVPNAQAASGRRIVMCPSEAGVHQEAYIALVSRTPHIINTGNPQNEALCRE